MLSFKCVNIEGEAIGGMSFNLSVKLVFTRSI